MKKIIFVLAFVFATATMFANTVPTPEFVTKDATLMTNEKEDDMGSCTVNLKGTVDGVSFDVTLVFDNVNFAECALLKTAIKLALN
ncbi:MAG: hypothetical protein ACK4TA_14245 [Saprospiraceae bacterium]